jgi:hypothetical protein
MRYASIGSASSSAGVCAVSSDSSRRKYLFVRMRWPLYNNAAPHLPKAQQARYRKVCYVPTDVLSLAGLGRGLDNYNCRLLNQSHSPHALLHVHRRTSAWGR